MCGMDCAVLTSRIGRRLAPVGRPPEPGGDALLHNAASREPCASVSLNEILQPARHRTFPSGVSWGRSFAHERFGVELPLAAVDPAALPQAGEVRRDGPGRPDAELCRQGGDGHEAWWTVDAFAGLDGLVDGRSLTL